MCVPLIPLALFAAGTVAKFIGEKQAEKARNTTFNAERDRQKAFEGEQTAKFQDSLDQTKGMQDPAAQAAAAAKREDTLASAIVPASAPGNYMPGSSSAPSVVATASDAAGAKSAENSASFARALAALGGTTDQMQGLNIGIGRNNQSIDQIGGFARGSMGVLDGEMKAASAKGGFLRGVGGLAQQIGGAWMGASGGSPISASTAARLNPDVVKTFASNGGIF